MILCTKPSILLLFLLILLLAGCGFKHASHDPFAPSQQIKELQTLLQKSLSLQQRQQVVQKLLVLYARLDQLEAVATSQVQLARLSLLSNDKEQAHYYVKTAEQSLLYINNTELQAQLFIIKATLEQQPLYYKKALSLSKKPLQQALLHALLGENEKALHVAEHYKKTHPYYSKKDFAIVLLQIAKNEKNCSNAEQALQLFRDAEDVMGIAKTLLLLAQLSRDTEPQKFKAYRHRAYLTIHSLKEQNLQSQFIEELNALWLS